MAVGSGIAVGSGVAAGAQAARANIATINRDTTVVKRFIFSLLRLCFAQVLNSFYLQTCANYIQTNTKVNIPVRDSYGFHTKTGQNSSEFN
jgi:hypothetical protein